MLDPVKTARCLKEAQSKTAHLPIEKRVAAMRAILRRLRKRMVSAVSPREFLTGAQYLNAVDKDGKCVLYPEVLKAYEDICSGRWVECVLTGGIGSGKTTLAVYVMAYMLYLLSKLENPQRSMGLDPTHEIGMVFQSRTLELACDVGYERFRALIETAPYFRKHFPFDANLKSKMKFPNRIVVKPVAGEATGTLGQNIIAAVVDELNFMQNVEKSTKAGGEDYDQAKSLYDSLSARRKTRFMSGGEMPGMLCLVSSRNYRGQFLDEKVAQANTNPDSGIYVYDKRVWDIKPWEFTSGSFDVFVGDLTRKPRILDPDEKIDEEDTDLVMGVPEEFRGDFENDLLKQLRDLAGVSTSAIHPFIMEPNKVAACFGLTRSVLSEEWTDFAANGVLMLPKRIQSKFEPRCAHVDLGLTGDSCGVAIGHVVGFVSLKRGEGVYETLPLIRFDLVLEVRPPRGGEITFSKVRELFYKLRKLGMPIKWVTYDSWQSRDSLQILHQEGFDVGELSVDKTAQPYLVGKQALYDGRVQAPAHETALFEWAHLEKDAKKEKIDHPPNGSKDCSDAMAGVIYGLSRKRAIWARHGVDPRKAPPSLREPVPKAKVDEQQAIKEAWDARIREAKRRRT